MSALPNLLTRAGPFALPGFQPDPENIKKLADANVLVIGAGGLGCELLKNLACSGFTKVTVIDLDTVDISNLNRQFLFRKSDINSPKAVAAAAFITKRCPWMKVTPINKPIQDFEPSWYRQFNVVIAGLDNRKAREWINQTLNSLVQFQYDEDSGEMVPVFETCIPLIDGGTEGLQGQAQLFYPKLSSCFVCGPPPVQQAHFHLCTIASVPRLPEHCIQYVYEVMWPLLKSFTSPTEYELYEQKGEDDKYVPAAVSLNKDSREHMTWIYERALERAERFKISGVTYKLTMQQVKNIIPALASTNAAIAASCCNEAVKVLTMSAQLLDNYLFHNGENMGGSTLHQIKKNPECPVCSPPLRFLISRTTTVQQLLDMLEAKGFDTPSVSSDSAVVYIHTPAKIYDDQLPAPVDKFIKPKELLTVSDSRKRTGSMFVEYSD